LLTVKGRAALEGAEVVVYDRLVGPEILALMPEGAKKIDVGKTASRHPVPQGQINQILVEEARAGHNVVRLKGGDPFLFGRGGEELEALSAAGVDFEEVPGITSAIAAAAYGGIPVTHRNYSSSLHIVTGRAKAGEPLSIDFDALVRTRGTLVFLMGVAALPEIVGGLLGAGMDGDTPAAMVENGTLPGQRRCDATLDTLETRAREMDIQSPALIVVGEVCRLAEALCWFERRPLHGKRIVVTRPKLRAGTLSARLRALGAEVIEFPCIETVPIDPCPAMDAAMENIGDYEWLVFTSPAGVEAFWARLRRTGRDARCLGGVRLAVTGPATAEALEKCGLVPDLMPGTYSGAQLGESLAKETGGRVLLLRAEEASHALTDALEAAGVPYDDVAVYRTRYGNPRSQALREALEAGRIDFVTFTSASTVKGFAAAVGEDADFSRTLGLCIGEQTAAEAGRRGIPVRVAAEAAIDRLVELAESEGAKCV
jgi:uroporphyrinogen III methyltransferase/synthase